MTFDYDTEFLSTGISTEDTSKINFSPTKSKDEIELAIANFPKTRYYGSKRRL